MLPRSSTAGARPLLVAPAPERPAAMRTDRQRVDEAVGLFMARNGLTRDEALAALTRASVTDEVDLHQLAQELCAAHDRAVRAGRG